MQLGQVEAETHAAHATRLAELTAQVTLANSSHREQLARLQTKYDDEYTVIRTLAGSTQKV